MTRKEKIVFIILAIWEIEGVHVPHSDFQHKSEDELDREVIWYEYLLTK